MTHKDSRAGGKYTGNHTTLIPLGAFVADIAHQCSTVTRISPGFIKAGLKSVGGKRRVKMVEKTACCLYQCATTLHIKRYMSTQMT